jgi:N-acetylmuramic acid 6-phosphate etherase
MAGGDFALIKSVEGFEDFQHFGRHQLESYAVGPKDTVVAVTEGGETNFVIGTAWAGVQAGAATFFVYNNPDVRLRAVDRTRAVLDEGAIGKLNLTTGPMAVAGSTRMQATTIELAVLAAALERALAVQCGQSPTSAATYGAWFRELLDELGSAASAEALADVAQYEADLYRDQRRVLYQADQLMLDVLTDTTERSPTFSLPPFRRRGEDRPASWSFAKNPRLPTPKAWRQMLGRPIRGLDWDRDAYARMQAPSQLIEHPPQLDQATILEFEIGAEAEATSADFVVSVLSPDDQPLSAYGCDAALRIGNATPRVGTASREWHLPLSLPRTALDLPLHFAAKMALNTISTTSMAILGRLTGHWMVYVRCSNMKLIDRGIRLLMDRADLDYEAACHHLHEAIVELENAPPDQATTSPVARALQRLGVS